VTLGGADRTTSEREGRPRISVVVPVYNTGRELERCISSILGQSMAPESFEAIFVDDGSTDESAARLDALAAEHPNVRVIHQENSGWPGKPRNVGIDVARGEYVFFMDHDDRLGPEALERMDAMAARTRPDILVPKIVGAGRSAPKIVFSRNRDKVTFRSMPGLVNTLTPQKMYRRSFLIEHGLRYPEGRRRLEDHVFVVAAYFAASAISVLGDYPCYFHHSVKGGTAASGRFDPTGSFDPTFYYPYLREVLAIVDANTSPGAFRDELLVRWAHGELLGRLGGGRQFPARFLHGEEEYRERMVGEIRGVVLDYIPASVDARLSPLQRTRMAILRSERPDRVALLLELAQQEADTATVARVDSIRPTTGGGLHVEATAELRLRGEPMLFQRDGSELAFPVPSSVEGIVPARDRRLVETASAARWLTIPLRGRWARALVVLRGGHETEVVTRSKASDRREVVGAKVRVVRHLAFTIDPNSLRVGSTFRPGAWDVLVRAGMVGVPGEVRLALGPEDLDQPATAPSASTPNLSTTWEGTDRHLVVIAIKAARPGMLRRVRRRLRVLTGR